MNDIEKMLYEKMKNRNFHEATYDDFSFVDSLIEQRDLARINEEVKTDGPLYNKKSKY